MRLSTAWVLFSFLLMIPVMCEAQPGRSSPFSNLRYKRVAVASDSLIIDSLSVTPGSFSVVGVDEASYHFYPAQSLLVWKQKPASDSVQLRYRVMAISLQHRYVHKNRNLVDSNLVFLIYQQDEGGSGSFVDFNQLEYNGSYGRSISLGNNQDVVLNSQFNLQVNGYILDSIKLEAAITDNTIPFQPEGNTQRLQEFDQIYIRLRKNGHYLQLGDYNLESSPGYFLKFFKRVQGLYYQTEFNLNRNVTNRLGLSGSVAKGQFARNIFQGQEGNQGPYKLTGNNGEQFFIVLAGTERIYVDNVLMERGENADYIINYNTAELRFMPRKMITKDSRIQAEFEYQDRNYLNSLIYAYDELQAGSKWKIRLNAYSNQDAKNQPYLQNLSGAQKRFLAQIGDSTGDAFYPVITPDTFAPNKILYRITDTIVNGLLYDSIFVYSAHPDSAKYSLSFSYVGEGRGDYIISSANANGRVYDWVAPVNGQLQGNYAPVQLLVTPKKQQVYILTSQYQLDSLKSLDMEVGASNTDPNLFSSIDNATHWGLATKLSYRETRFAGGRDSAGNRRMVWQNAVSYEYVQDRFRAVAPFRNVEFGRDWNVPQLGPKPDEHLVYAITRLAHRRYGTADYNFSYYQRGADYRGYRNIISYSYSGPRVRTGFTANALSTADSSQRSVFYRPSLFAEYLFKSLMNTYLGARYELEHNELRNKRRDTLLASAFSFDIASVYLRTSDMQPMRWGLTYFTRRDRLPRFNSFLIQNQSHNVELKLGFYQWKNHQLGFTGNYRQLVIHDSTVIKAKPEQTLLGRLEYTGTLLRNVVSLNTLYEFGSGQEQKRSFTYVEVPAGQGIYTWIDYNADGVQQSNEFETALYPDQRRFIRVFTPTNDYVKVNYASFNFSLMLEPSYFWPGGGESRLQRFISRFSGQTSLQISNRLLEDEGIRAYSPFLDVLNDASIILTNSSLSNSIYFNRSNTRWGLDYNLLYNAGKQLLTYGVEGNQTIQHLYRLRWNMTRSLTMNLTARHGDRGYRSALDDNRSYDVASRSGEPSLVWLHRSVLRLTAALRYEERRNLELYGGEQAKVQSANLELRYSKPATGIIQLRGTYSRIDFTGKLTDPVSFIMLDFLQKGHNYLWYMTWERRVGKGMEISLEYEGRKPGTGRVIHTGRMSVRAIL